MQNENFVRIQILPESLFHFNDNFSPSVFEKTLDFATYIQSSAFIDLEIITLWGLVLPDDISEDYN